MAIFTLRCLLREVNAVSLIDLDSFELLCSAGHNPDGRESNVLRVLV